MIDLIAQIDSADSHYFKKELLEFQYIQHFQENASTLVPIIS